MKKVLLGIVLCMLMVGVAFASEADKKAAVALVDQAASMMKASGKDATLKEISTAKGKFDKGELYVFAYDYNGVMIAHPKNAKLIGQKLIDKLDVPGGKPFRKEIVAIGKAGKTGWVDYKYKNPKTGAIEEKTTYVLGMDGVVLCCGVYK